MVTNNRGVIVIRERLWLMRLYRYWGAHGGTYLWRENLCHFVRVIVLWVPLIWLFEPIARAGMRVRPVMIVWWGLMAAFVAVVWRSSIGWTDVNIALLMAGCLLWTVHNVHLWGIDDPDSFSLVSRIMAYFLIPLLGVVLTPLLAVAMAIRSTYKYLESHEYTRWLALGLDWFGSHRYGQFRPWMIAVLLVYAGYLFYQPLLTIAVTVTVVILVFGITFFLTVSFAYLTGLWQPPAIKINLGVRFPTEQIVATYRVIGHFLWAQKARVCPYIEFDTDLARRLGS